MKFILSTVLTVLFSVSAFSQGYMQMIEEGTHTVQEIIDNAEAYFADKDKGRGSGYKQFKRWEYHALRMMNDEGYLPSQQYWLDNLNTYNAYLNETAGTRQLLNDNWVELGPTSIDPTSSWSPGVGRMTGIAVDRTNTDHIITGGFTGGIWRTLDGGQNWTPLSDNFINLEVHSVTIAPNDSDTYFFGSGLGQLYKSEDAGATWAQIGTAGTGPLNKILINPDDPNLMFATNQSSGIYTSTDGGENWTLVADDRGYDVEFQPGSTSVVYASGRFFYKSTDGGATFTQIDIDGVTDNARSMLAVSENNPDIIYLLHALNSFAGIFKSEDAGETWIELNHTGRNYMNASSSGTGTGGQAPRDMDIVVHPDNPDQVHIAGVNEWRSMDGGVSFSLNASWFLPDAIGENIGYMHADVDYLEFVDGKLYAATDGGVFVANNPTDNVSFNYYEDITTGLGTQQFYKIAASQSQQAVVSGGTQDNGTTAFREATNDFVGWLGADGGGTGIDIDNPSRIYGTTQFGDVWRSFNAGNTGVFTGQTAGDGPFVTPLEADKIDANTAYSVTDRVWRTTNFAGSWQAISQVFSSGNLLRDVQVSASNNQVLYASRAGFMYKTIDGGATAWEILTNPGGVVNNIAIHPRDPNLVAVAVQGGRRVRITRDGGNTWEDYNTGLPNFAALTVIWDDNNKEGLYLGMNYGIYYIDNTMDEWIPYNNGLPNVIVSDLDINNVTNTLYAGTFGRGLWASPLVEDGPLSVEGFLNDDSVKLFPNPAQTAVNISLPAATEADIRIFNIQGALVKYEKDVQISGIHTIDINSLQAGTYFVRLNSELGTITKKLIKN